MLAPAKLTRSLRITGVRADGYHLIDAEFVSLDLADELTFTDGDDVRYTGEYPVTAGHGDDLVARALRAVRRRAAVTVHKRIPVGGGLGGGSADAAAVLRWAGCTDIAVAAALGADVPFCLRGGRARVGGVGEVLEPLPFVPLAFTLLVPPLASPTPPVYRRWDAMGGPVGDSGNDLEPAAVAEQPELARWRDVLGDATGLTPRLAGSGSTWFVEGEYPGAGRIVAHAIPAYD